MNQCEADSIGHLIGIRSLAWRRLLSGGVFAGALFAFAPNAHARECTADADCPKGFTCEETGTVPCPTIDCAPDSECEPIDCADETYSECVSVDCTSDSDCAEGMVCHTQTWQECSGAGCPPGASDEECAKLEDTCAEESSNSCVPRYLLPCQADADCGDGFSCVELESCSCSGSSGSGSSGSVPPDSGGGTEPVPDPDAPSDDAADGGASGDADEPSTEPEPQDPTCSCEPSGDFVCQLEINACETNSDCPDSFECAPNPDSGVCWQDANGDSGCSEPDPAKVCMPPYYDISPTGRAISESGVAVGSTSNEDQATDGAGEPTAPADRDDSIDGSGEAASAAGTETSSSTGCQVSSGMASPNSLLSALGLLAFAAWISRRKPARQASA